MYLRRYVLITLLISWTSALIFQLIGGVWQGWQATVFGLMYMVIPTLCIFLMPDVAFSSFLKQLFRTTQLKWFLLAWITPVVLALAAFGVALVFPDVNYSPDVAGLYERLGLNLSTQELADIQAAIDHMPVHPFFVNIFGGMFMGISINALVAMGEELGWRGYLLKQAHYLGFVKSTLVIGVIWGIWHAPLILMGHNYPHFPWIGIIFMTAFCILSNFVITYIRVRAQTIVVAAVYHGTLNATSGIAVMMLHGGNELQVGVMGASGLLVLLFVVLGVVRLTKTSGFQESWSAMNK